MMLFWKIRYFDRADREFKDRNLYLRTETLEPVTRAAVELVAENQSHRRDRDILRYRHLFTEDARPDDDMSGIDRFIGVGPSEYFEDETGREIAPHEMGPLLTGSPTAVLIPSGARQHDIDLMMSERTPLPMAGVVLTPDEVRLLGYFARDLREMLDSALRRDGPGKIKTVGTITIGPESRPVVLETAVTDDEVRSFVTIFRRLYMDGEPANFLKATDVFVRAVGDHPYGCWVAGVAGEYQNQLAAPPDVPPFLPSGTCTFTAKRLIDVFLYTQYAHQPKADRQRQFIECLGQVHGHRSVLTWLFFTTIWQASLVIGNSGRVIVGWFGRYCEHHGVTPDVLDSIRHDHAGLGAAEKEADRQDRLFQEKVEELAADMWRQHGRPEAGPAQFLATAREQLGRALGRGSMPVEGQP